jgi:hypothetical protein
MNTRVRMLAAIGILAGIATVSFLAGYQFRVLTEQSNLQSAAAQAVIAAPPQIPLVARLWGPSTHPPSFAPAGNGK